MALTKVNASNIVDGVLPVANGGTGATTQAGAAAAVLPSQTGQAGKYLATDGTNTSWDQINISTADITGTLPVANGGTGQTTANAGFNALAPSQSGNSGKYLTTDGTNTSWGTVTAPTPAAVSDQNNTSTGYFDLPSGTTAQRPASPSNGMTRFNTTLGYPEWYSETYSTWVPFYDAGPYSIDYLVVAGGGAGSDTDGGGGGAGGYIALSGSVSPNTAYTITIGAGAPRTTVNWTRGANGSNSSAFGQTAIGGGGGGTGASPASPSDGFAQNGGSGGGAGSTWSSGRNGAGTAGQGTAGGNGASGQGGGGGGGAGAAGQNAPGGSPSQAGTGGNGLNWQSLGTFYAGGGGGGHGAAGATDAAGGLGGGGRGTVTGNGLDATANTGGGGGGGGGNNGDGGAGGSGIVIIRYLGSQRGSGGTVTSSGGYTYHTFTTSGTYTA